MRGRASQPKAARSRAMRAGSHSGIRRASDLTCSPDCYKIAMICSSLNLFRFIPSDSFASDSTFSRSHFRGARQVDRSGAKSDHNGRGRADMKASIVDAASLGNPIGGPSRGGGNELAAWD